MRRKFNRYVFAAARRIRIVKSPVILTPILVPRTRLIWDRIVSAWLLADPEDRRDDVFFPRILFIRLRTSVMVQMSRRKSQRIETNHEVLRKFIGFLAYFDLARRSFGRPRLRKKRRDGRQYYRGCVSNGSGFHFKMRTTRLLS